MELFSKYFGKQYDFSFDTCSHSPILFSEHRNSPIRSFFCLNIGPEINPICPQQYVSEMTWLQYFSEMIWLQYFSEMIWLQHFSEMIWLQYVCEIIWLHHVSKMIWQWLQYVASFLKKNIHAPHHNQPTNFRCSGGKCTLSTTIRAGNLKITHF